MKIVYSNQSLLFTRIYGLRDGLIKTAINKWSREGLNRETRFSYHIYTNYPIILYSILKNFNSLYHDYDNTSIKNPYHLQLNKW